MRILLTFMVLLLPIVEAIDGINDWTNIDAINVYINADEIQYYETKQRAQEVVDKLREKADLSHQKALQWVRKKYVEYREEMPNSVFPGRESIVIEHTKNEYKYWKKQIEAKRELIIEDYMGGTGGYYAANMLEIEELLDRLNK